MLSDDPAFTVREHELNISDAHEIAEHQPLRVIVDSHLRTPENARIFEDVERCSRLPIPSELCGHHVMRELARR